MSSSSIRVNPSISSFSSEHDIFLEDVHSTITELELNIAEHHRNELNFRTIMHAQSEQLKDLRTSLDVERNRNQRLAKLIRRVDSSTSSSGSEVSAGSIESSRWHHSRPSIDAFESISPLLMQHRYDELSMSYKQCHRQLAKKDVKLRDKQCEIEMLQGKYDNLMDEHKRAQKRVEQLCCKYLRLHANKNREIVKLKEALGYAVQCIMNESSYDGNEKEILKRNLQLFIRSLKNSINDGNKYE